MFSWGAVLVWGEIGGMNSTERVTQPATRVTQHGQIFFCVAFDKSKPSQTLHHDGLTRKFPTVPSQLQHLLIVVKVPEVRSFTHCVLSRPTQGREKVTKKEMQQMQQDKRLPQLSMDVDNQKLSRLSLPLTGAIFEVLLTPHQVWVGVWVWGGWEVGRVGGQCPR
ncbi:hypothetical protein BU17DRAFT_62615 [Hysterangium stoloniferum]|nr:hypothetical protein BU17DRAFT_62615 [Hysterangium stoloniferum]